jgi:glycosyltransferase involved in cell wall biosynthesis
MQRPNVLHVINNLNVSGATTLLLDVAASVRPGPGELTVCTLEPENPMAGALCETGARVISPERKLGVASATRWLRRIIEQERPKIVHTHLLPATQAGLAAAKLEGRPAVTTVHFTFDCLRANVLLRQANRVSYRFYDRIFAVSHAVRQSILDHCAVGEDRVVVIRSGVDLARVTLSAEARSRARRKLGLPADDLVVGSVGRMDAAKGFHLLVAAMALLHRTFSATRLILVGDGPERERLEQQASDVGIGDAVVFAGEQKDPKAFAAAFDIFVLPSLSEGLGLSIIEAMGAGLPVIGSTAGGIPEVVSDETSGLLFQAGDIGALARCLERLVRSPALRRRLAVRGQARVRTEFGIEQCVERLCEEYAEILRGATTARSAGVVV